MLRRSSLRFKATTANLAHLFNCCLPPVQLENRNSRVSGFRDQDVVTLQKILDAEFEVEKESIMKHQREKREQAAKQAGLQKKRMMLERQLREEISEIGKDHQIEFWLTLVSFPSTLSANAAWFFNRKGLEIASNYQCFCVFLSSVQVCRLCVS